MAAWKPGIEILLWFCNYGTNRSALSAQFGWANIWLCIFTQVSQWLLCLWKKKSSDILSLARTHICLCIINDGAMRLIGSNIILFINYLLWRTEIGLTLLQKYWYFLYFSGCWVIHRRCRYFIKENPSWMGKVCFCVPI